jgi:hypothetical protein
VPARPSGKGRLKESNAVESGPMRSRARKKLSRVPLHLNRILNSYMDPARAAFGTILNLTWGKLL